ncbi:MAG TPA: DUF6208 family protein [Kofleriaceae bacterium]|nr:DUF6208 family protein [Kofleriaceae bacterium]
MNLTGSVARVVQLPWVAPLSVCSFAFHRAMRARLRARGPRIAGPDAARAPRWHLLPRALLAHRGALAWMMTTGPRLNAHAIIALSDPLAVRGALSLHVADAARSARTWSVVVYELPRFRTVATIGSNDAAPAPWRDLELPPGSYALGVRYYHPADAAELPAVRVDGEDRVPALALPGQALSVWDSVRDRRGLFYRCLHYYMFHLLEYRDWFPAAFIEREFLPVGNPQTHFAYGAVRKGQSLMLRSDAALLATHDVFFTLYNRCSFPVTWYPITHEEHAIAEVPATGFYLVRMHRRAGELRAFERAWITVHAA